jgi:hypothetical protein
MSEIRETIAEYFTPITVVSEMATGSGVLLPIADNVREAVTEGDPDPKFATFVIEEGMSRSKRLWDRPVFLSVQEQFAKAIAEEDPIVGYLGHIKPDDDSFAFPEIQFQWLTSKLSQVGDKVRFFTKAYVLPDTKARYYLSKKLAKSVSWRGDAIMTPIRGGLHVKDFALESIDLARPRKAGMSARMVGSLASEMEQEGNSVKPEEIAALQENELRAHAPNLVASIETAARKPVEDKVQEMTAAAEATKPVVDAIPEIRTLLGIGEGDNLIDALKKHMETLKLAAKSARGKLLDTELEKRIKDEGTRKLVRRVLVGEMESKADDLGLELTDESEDADSKKVGEMVVKFIDGDAELKAVVGEMMDSQADPGGKTEKDRTGSGDGSGYKPGTKNERILVRSAL